MKKPISVIYDEILSDEKRLGELMNGYGLLRSDILDSLDSTRSYLENKFIECDFNHFMNTFHAGMKKIHGMKLYIEIDRRLFDRFATACAKQECSMDDSIKSWIIGGAYGAFDDEPQSCPFPMKTFLN